MPCLSPIEGWPEFSLFERIFMEGEKSSLTPPKTCIDILSSFSFCNLNFQDYVDFGGIEDTRTKLVKGCKYGFLDM